jgi:hypothetical protein
MQDVGGQPLLEHPYDVIWLIGAATLATVFGLTGLALVVDAIRNWHRALGAAFGLAGGVIISAAFVTVAMLLLHWAAPNTG